MTHADLSIRGALSWGGTLRRAVAVGAVIALAAAPQLAHGGLALPVAHLHAPRWELLLAAPAVLRLHITAALLALAVGTALLAGVKGTGLHKALGWTWVAAMGVTAVSSFWIRAVNPGHWSCIHFLSGWVVIALPMAVAAIKRRNVRLHRRLMTGLFVGGLVVAGAFTFVPGRLMWATFFG